jgi:uncharacterized protein (TIGR02302 family)
MTDKDGAQRRRHEIPHSVERQVKSRIDHAVSRARLVLLWENLWPRLLPLGLLAAAFFSLSWFGIWRTTPDWLRWIALALFGLGLVYALLRIVRVELPDRSAALARVETASGSTHRPATSYSDRLVSAPEDPVARTLWNVHRQRLLGALDRLRAGIPEPKLARRDPFAFRFLAILILVVAFVSAGPERIERVIEAFRGGESVAATIARIDAWVTPPAYTGRAPIFLTGDAAKPAGTVHTVPEGSIVTVRTGGNRDLTVVSAGPGGETPAERVEDPGAKTARKGDALPPLEHRVTLDRGAEVTVRRDERDISTWRFTVEDDAAPEIALARPPAPTASGALSLAYTIRDDYGVVGAEATFVPLADPEAQSAKRPLFAAPAFPLSLPQLRARSGQGETMRDLTSHPWAGAKVLMTLVARDDAKQEGRSEPVELILPSRRFMNPLARAVVEQRARLALDANAAGTVADALDALTFAPEKRIDDLGHYLTLRSAYRRLVDARDDDALRDVADYLWTIALGIEDGDLSLSAQALRDAQEALRQALENGASDEEIKRLTQQLRDAMQKFLQALADEARRNPQMSNLPPDANIQMLRSQDLERLLDRIEELAQSGARDAARQLLSELQNMLENLQAGRPMMGDEQSNQMMQSLNQLGDMIRRQQQLMDETHRAERGMDPNGQQQPGQMTEEQLQQALRNLQQGQEQLQQQLEQLMQQLGEMGMEPNGKLGQAGESMGEAAEALGEGSPGSALGDQGQALEALRQGAQGLAQQLAQQGQGRGPGGMRSGENFPNEDPLGRPQRTTGPDLGTQVKVPDEIDTQRAREILDAIRKRLGETTRPQIERDYLERLLDRF